MDNRDEVLLATFGRLYYYFLGGGLVILAARGPIWPLLIAAVALVYILAGFTALSKADDRRNRRD